MKTTEERIDELITDILDEVEFLNRKRIKDFQVLKLMLEQLVLQAKLEGVKEVI